MQAEPPYNSLSLADSGMASHTDDEMVDYEAEALRDEDYDIELEQVENYETYQNDPEGSVVMDDMPDCDQKMGSDHDDEMLDEDVPMPGDMMHESSDVQISYEEQYTDVVIEDTADRSGTQDEMPTNLDREDVTQSTSEFGLDHTQPISEVEQPAEVANEEETVDHGGPIENESAENAETFSTRAEDHGNGTPSENSEHSSTTLREERALAEGNPADESKPSEEHQAEEAEAEEYTYPHPVIVTYDYSPISLFPPLDLWSEETPVGEVFQSVPQDFFLEDTQLCDKGFDQLFAQLREVLGDSITNDDELWFDLELLGLSFGEDNLNCRNLSLRDLLDVHNNLYRHDGVEIPPPVKLNLYTSPRFGNRLEFISAVLHEGKGLRDCLQLLNLADHNQEAEETITATVADIEDEIKTTEQTNYEEKQTPVVAGLSDKVAEAVGAVETEEEVEIFDDDDDESPLDNDAQKSAEDLNRVADSQPEAESPAKSQPSEPRPQGLNSIPVVALSPSNSAAEQEELLEYDENPDDHASVSSPSAEQVRLQDEAQATNDIPSENDHSPEEINSHEHYVNEDGRQPGSEGHKDGEQPSQISVYDGDNDDPNGHEDVPEDFNEDQFGGSAEDWHADYEDEAELDNVEEIGGYGHDGVDGNDHFDANDTEYVADIEGAEGDLNVPDEVLPGQAEYSQESNEPAYDGEEHGSSNDFQTLALAHDGAAGLSNPTLEEQVPTVIEPLSTPAIAQEDEDEEELIDYDDEDQEDLRGDVLLHRSHSQSSLTPQKRERDDLSEGSLEDDVDNQATKRPRAE